MSKQLEVALNEKFYIFDNFLTSNKHIIERGDKEWDSSKIFFQLSIEHADNSPLTQDAEKFEEDGKVYWDYIRDVNSNKKMYISPLVAILDDHSDRINGLNILENGNILSYSYDSTLRIWDKDSYECIAVLEDHNDVINGIKVLDNQNILSFSADNTMRVWDKKSYQCVAVLKSHTDIINGVDILENGNIISYSDDKTLRIWDKESYECLKILSGHEDNVNGLIQSNKYMVSWSGNDIYIWNINDFSLETYIEDHTTFILKLSEDYFISISSHKTILVWSFNETIENTTVLEPLKNDFFIYDNSVIKLDEKTIAVGYHTHIKVWNIETGKIIKIIEKQEGVKIIQGNQLLSWKHSEAKKEDKTLYNRGGFIKPFLNKKDISIQLTDINSFNQKRILYGHTTQIIDVIKHNKFIVSYTKNVVKVWNETEEIIHIDTSDSISNISIIDDYRFIVSGSNKIKIYDMKNSKYSKLIMKYPSAGQLLLENDNILSWHNNEITIYDKNNYNTIITFVAHTKKIKLVALLANNNIISHAEDCDFMIWDKDDYSLIKILTNVTDALQPGVLNLLNNNFITWDRNKLTLWCGKTYNKLNEVSKHDKFINGTLLLESGDILSWSADGSIIISNKLDFSTIYTLKLDSQPIIRYVSYLEFNRYLIQSLTGYYICKIIDNIIEVISQLEAGSSLSYRIIYDESLILIGNDCYNYNLKFLYKNDNKFGNNKINYKEYIMENKLNNRNIKYHLEKNNIYWHSDYIPKVLNLIGDSVMIKDGENLRILKVVTHK